MTTGRTKQLVINTCYGGFGLSDEAVLRYGELKGLNLKMFNDGSYPAFYIDGVKDDDHYFSIHDIERHEPELVQTVEELGDLASGVHASLKIVEIPADVKYQLEEYDGREWVAEQHRTWS